MTSEQYGYGKPPVKSQFKPGQSGNPKGKPKGRCNVAADLIAELSEQLVVTECGKKRRITKQRAVIKALLSVCLKGKLRAIEMLLRLVPEAEVKVEAEHRKEVDRSVAEAVATATAILDQFDREEAAGVSRPLIRKGTRMSGLADT